MEADPSRFAARVGRMAQCESKVFFPDGPEQRPQFTDCPRQAETTRKLSGMKLVKLCTQCAKIWDETDFISVGIVRGERTMKFAEKKVEQ